jgi:hypothetical protein
MSSVVASRRARNAVPTLPVDVALEYRPSAYFAPWSAPAIAAILRCGRRSALRGITRQSAGMDEQHADRTPLDEDVRRTLHRIHPSLTDGQFLPTLQPCETEIARITFASTTHDVTAVYARQRKDGVFYRVVDEYGGRTLSAPRERTRFSRRPLTLRELAAFIARACPALAALAENHAASSEAGDALVGFEVRAESEFYPGFASLVDARIGTSLALPPAHASATTCCESVTAAFPPVTGLA